MLLRKLFLDEAMLIDYTHAGNKEIPELFISGILLSIKTYETEKISSPSAIGSAFSVSIFHSTKGVKWQWHIQCFETGGRHWQMQRSAFLQ